MVTAAAGGKAPARPRPTPSQRFSRPDDEQLEQESQERQEFIANDPVVKSSGGKDSVAILMALKLEVARETASLAYQRLLNERAGKDISQVSSRRIDALKKIADIELEMRKIGVDQIDVYGEKVQKLFNFWIELIKSAAAETMSQQQADLFFNRLTSILDGWEEKAEELVR